LRLLRMTFNAVETAQMAAKVARILSMMMVEWTSMRMGTA